MTLPILKYFKFRAPPRPTMYCVFINWWKLTRSQILQITPTSLEFGLCKVALEQSMWVSGSRFLLSEFRALPTVVGMQFSWSRIVDVSFLVFGQWPNCAKIIPIWSLHQTLFYYIMKLQFRMKISVRFQKVGRSSDDYRNLLISSFFT